MLYWDSSAVVAVALNEPSSGEIRAFAESIELQPAYTSFFTFLEVESAIQRKLKDRSINLKDADQGRMLAVGFRHSSQIIVADLLILDLSLHFQKLYGLRPGDAVQLASARNGTDNPSRTQFLCLDEKLCQAARREGFIVPF